MEPFPQQSQINIDDSNFIKVQRILCYSLSVRIIFKANKN